VTAPGHIPGLLAPLVVAVGITVTGCGEPRSAGADAPSTGTPARSLEVDPSAPRALSGVDGVPAAGVRGPGGTHFSVVTRTDAIVQYPCHLCHDAPLEPRAASDEVSERWAHQEIQLGHAAGMGMTCATCHDHTQMNRLVGSAGERVSFDHAYRVCAQCHHQELRDWAGGAHGKRLGGWRGERVVLSCTGCHDPHDPVTPSLAPVTGPSVPRSGWGH